ncbi:MAG: nitroreductase family protein [Herbinix sp.]|nr:nitroreductase family protein [Herbinix sp.]
MNDEMKLKIMELRETMKAYEDNDDEDPSDQAQGLPQPPLSKSSYGSKMIPLARNFEKVVTNNNFIDLINTRTSKRKYTEEAISLEELAFLLWTTQGVKEVIGKNNNATLRTVPSAGARHPFETYLVVNKVEGLTKGLYHYLAIEHKLELIKEIEEQRERITEAAWGQAFLGTAAVDFIWSAVPYRCEWRYTLDAHKYILLDAGHVCQNLYLASEAIGCGTCAIGAYDQNLIDNLIGLNTKTSSDTDNEFVVYIAAVGKVK